MKLNQSLSWKITLPLAVILFLFMGDVGKFLALILGVLGIIDLIRSLTTGKNNKQV